MTGKRAKSTSKPAVSKTSKDRFSKDQQLEAMGVAVEEIEKRIKSVSGHYRSEFTEIVSVELGALNAREERILNSLLKDIPALLLSTTMPLIRRCVEIDQSSPIHAKYAGRALRELNALDEKTGKTLIEIFAFFATGPANSVLRPPEPGDPDYRVVASECTIPKGSVKKKLPEEANRASKRLSEAVERLESLGLVDACRSPAGKRITSYLRFIGHEVFNGWPAWPAETPGGSAT